MSTAHLVNVRPMDEDITEADGPEHSPYWVDCACGWWVLITGRANALARADAHLDAHPLPTVTS